MPATPRFKVSQTDDAVIVIIKVPHVRVGSAEMHVDGREFSFYCKPYLLRLTLPLEIGGEEDGSCKAVYDPADDNGTITATLTKATPGAHFPDLDLTTTLLQPRWTPADLVREQPNGDTDGAPASSGVEVISSEHYDGPDCDTDVGVTPGKTCGEIGTDSKPTAQGGDGIAANGGSDGEGKGSRDATGNVWSDGERVAESGVGVEGLEILIRPPTYGFNDKFSGFFTSLRDELREMIHLADPDNTPRSKRRELRLEHEKTTFDADRYLGDLFTEEEDPLLTEALAFEPHWKTCRWPPPPSQSDSSPVAGGASSDNKSETDGGVLNSSDSKKEIGGSGVIIGFPDSRRNGGVPPPPCPLAPACEMPTPTSPSLPPPAQTNDTAAQSLPPPQTNGIAAVSTAQTAAASSEGENKIGADGGGGVSQAAELVSALAGGDCGASLGVELSSASAQDDGKNTERGEGGTGSDTGAVTTSAGKESLPSAGAEKGSEQGDREGKGENVKEGLSSEGGEKGGGQEEGEGEDKKGTEALSSAGGEKGGRRGGEEGEGAGENDGVFAGFTEREEEQMRRLPNREYLIPAGGFEEKRALLGLADILFAYAYDHRTTGGDATVESAWTVAVLSPLLTWLEAPEGDVDETCVALAGLRRSLIFPYLRVWELGALVVKDVRDILTTGKRCILRCLLQTYAILERGEVHYLLNKLFIEDYCVWIQKASETSLAAFAKRYAAAAASITKSGVRLDLERIEAEAVGVTAAREAEGEKGNAEESSGENSEDSSEESSSDDSSSSGEEESSSEEEENAEDNGDESGSNGREGAEKVATTTPRTKEPNATATPHAKPSIDGNQDAITADDLTVLTEEAPGAAAGARGDNRVEETPGSGIRGSVSCGSGSGSARTGSRVERSSDLLDLESRVDNGAGKPASVVADRLSSLSLGKSREPLDSLAEGGQPSGASKGSGAQGLGIVDGKI